MKNNFYVYAYCNSRQRNFKHPMIKYEPFYIGKGCNKRYLSHLDKCKKNQSITNKYLEEEIHKLLNEYVDVVITLVQTDLSEYDALMLEYELIELYGRRNYEENGLLTNSSKGFENFNLPNEANKEDIKALINSQKHFNCKEVHKDIVKEICRLYDKENWSFNNLYKKFHIGTNKIRQILIENNIRIKTKSETRKGKLNPMYGTKRINGSNPRAIKVQYKNKIYECKKDLCKNENISYHKMNKMIKNGEIKIMGEMYNEN